MYWSLKCDVAEDLKLCLPCEAVIVAVILSTVDHLEYRDVIRRTWTSPKHSKAVQCGHIVIYFIIAAPRDSYDMSRLIAEQEQYNDLIVTDVHESYENLVLKL
ncbi:hypothetical protein OESDEN_01547 [Oesophagostomum dentatum]|uniref:Hexosyltransferase n=1 Tax=Oesophagostomum dentatum TaxID=61180 RepID=A0A0B1TSS1_OESDE|nr:hypothetical protein OESDEN_01547 [Oesophagostomum dentatum]